MFSLVLTAQTAPKCGTIESAESLEYYQNHIDQITAYEQSFLNNTESQRTITSIPVKAHIIRTSSGTGGLSMSQLNAAMNVMNSFYANANMQFYLCQGVNYIDNSAYYNYVDSSEDVMTNTYNVDGLINIYFAESVTRSSSGNTICGYAFYPGGPDTIIMDNSCAQNGSTLSHEMGHFFNLRHTHGSSSIPNELVDGSNCTTAGDYICDTPADPTLSYSNVTASCIYVGNDTDGNGSSYFPDTANVMSYSRKECRTLFSLQQYARIYATFQTVRNNFTCATFDVDFIADETQTCDNTLTVNFSDNSIGATAWEWDVNGDDVIDYTTQNPTHVYNTPGYYDVSLTISNDESSIVKSEASYISVGSNENLPLSKDFNTDLNIVDNGWNVTSNSSFSWVLNSGTTPTSNTGPLGDNSASNNGFYIYTEASDANFGDVATYTTPCVEINSNDAILSFYYHMFGSNMGELHVDIDSGSGFTNDVTPVIDGQQQVSNNADFIERQVDLSAYANQSIVIRFRAVRGNGFNSDIAIDDIDINGTLSVDDYFNNNVMSLYPNPTTNILNIHLSNANDLPDGYVIYNLLGQEINTKTILGREDLSIKTDHLSNGIYYLKVLKGNQTQTLSFIKN